MARKNDEDEFSRLSSSKRIRKHFLERFLQIKNELYNIGELEFDENYETAISHDDLIDICVSAFGPESKCFKEVGYFFISSDPLYECNLLHDQPVKNYDVLIFNAKEKHAIFVECKSSLSKHGKCIADAYEAREQIIHNQIYLENKIGDKIKTMEFVICLPAENIEHFVREIEKREDENTIDLKRFPPLLIWQVNKFKGEVLQLFSRINSREDEFLCQHRNRQLTRILGGHYVVNSEVIVSFYPSSHPFKISKKIISSILNKNQKAGNENLNEFSLKDIKEYCKSFKNTAHYAYEEIGEEIADRFIRKNLAFELIEPIKDKSGFFRLKSKSKRFDTLFNNYQTEYRKAAIEKIVERKTKKQVVDEFTAKKDLFSFD